MVMLVLKFSDWGNIVAQNTGAEIIFGPYFRRDAFCRNFSKTGLRELAKDTLQEKCWETIWCLHGWLGREETIGIRKWMPSHESESQFKTYKALILLKGTIVNAIYPFNQKNKDQVSINRVTTMEFIKPKAIEIDIKHWFLGPLLTSIL